MEPKQSFLNYLLGTDNYSLYAAQWVAALVGIFVSLLLHAVNRDPKSPQTPFCWSWKFLFGDNTKRMILSVLLVFITLRFPTYILKLTFQIDLQDDKNSEWAMFVALAAGVLNDMMAKKLKDVNFLGIAQTKAKDNIQKPQ